MAEASKDTFVSLGGTDISCFLNSSDLNLLKEQLETSAFSKDSKTFINGLKDSSFDLSGPNAFAGGELDATLWAAFDGTATVTLIVGFQGNTAGEVRYSVEVNVSAYTPGGSSLGSAVTASATLQGTGDVTRDTFP